MSDIMRLSGKTDCHTSDIGHWFAMTKTNFVYSLRWPPKAAIFFHNEKAAPYKKYGA